MTEKELLEAVRGMAKWTGWLAYHPHDSRFSEPGFPDLVLVQPSSHRLLFAELKSTTGALTVAQRTWLQVLSEIGGTQLGITGDGQVMVGPAMPEVYLWRPRDWTSGRIERILTADAELEELGRARNPDQVSFGGE